MWAARCALKKIQWCLQGMCPQTRQLLLDCVLMKHLIGQALDWVWSIVIRLALEVVRDRSRRRILAVFQLPEPRACRTNQQFYLAHLQDRLGLQWAIAISRLNQVDNVCDQFRATFFPHRNTSCQIKIARIVAKFWPIHFSHWTITFGFGMKSHRCICFT